MFRMLKLVILSVVGVLAASAGDSIEWKTMQKIHKFNLLSKCWGDEAMTQFAVWIHKACEFCEEIPLLPTAGGLTPFNVYNPRPAAVEDNQIEALRGLLANPSIAALIQPQGWASTWQPFLSNGRSKRAAALLNPTDVDRMEFAEDIADFKQDMQTKIGNLTCVLTQMKMCDANGNINMDAYSYESMSKMFGQTPAGSDPVFLRKLADSFSDCYDISRAWPQQALDRNPLTKEHGRHMVFFECAKKVEDKLCAQFEIKQWMETLYGPIEENAEKFGITGDVYDAATMALKVKYSGASEEMKFVDDFFWGKSMM